MPATAQAQPDLDAWLADPAVRTHHHRAAAADPSTLWAAAETVRIGECGLLGRIIRWRVKGSRAESTYRELFTSQPFVVLDAGPRHLLSGVCGRIWTARPALAQLGSSAQFRDWALPGTVRVLFAQWVVPAAAGAMLASETRVAPVDRSAQRALRGIWPLVGRFQGLIAAEPLRIAVERAEAARADRPTGPHGT